MDSRRNTLWPISISDSLVMVWLALLRLRVDGGFSGEEKMPSMGSIPCSSRTPLSLSTIPVLLSSSQLSLCARRRADCIPSGDADVRIVCFGRLRTRRGPRRCHGKDAPEEADQDHEWADLRCLECRGCNGRDL